MPRIGVDKQTGIELAIKTWWITGTLFGSKGIRPTFYVEKRVDFVGIENGRDQGRLDQNRSPQSSQIG